MSSPYSVRNQILLAMQGIFTGIDPNAATTVTLLNPSGDPIGISFTTVGIGPLELKDLRKQNAIGIVAGSETKLGSWPVWNCTWNVNLEFRSAVNQDDINPGLIAERTLTAIERIVYANRSWTGLAIDTLDIGNEIDLDSYATRAVLGVYKMIVKYRHSEGDPRIIVP